MRKHVTVPFCYAASCARAPAGAVPMAGVTRGEGEATRYHGRAHRAPPRCGHMLQELKLDKCSDFFTDALRLVAHSCRY
uniref:Uncharacterized protein n=1 Tax=Oryza punctata TaxID=4537 RepID=A0A0E0MHL9_ORYPU